MSAVCSRAARQVVADERAAAGEVESLGRLSHGSSALALHRCGLSGGGGGVLSRRQAAPGVSGRLDGLGLAACVRAARPAAATSKASSGADETGWSCSC